MRRFCSWTRPHTAGSSRNVRHAVTEKTCASWGDGVSTKSTHQDWNVISSHEYWIKHCPVVPGHAGAEDSITGAIRKQKYMGKSC